MIDDLFFKLQTLAPPSGDKWDCRQPMQVEAVIIIFYLQ